MKHLKKIETYWERRMSREEEEAFEQEMKTNAELREEMNAYEASLRLLELAAVDTLEQKRPAQMLPRWMALAAALAVLLAVALFAYANLNYSAERIAERSYEVPVFSDMIRGERTADGGRPTADSQPETSYPELAEGVTLSLSKGKNQKPETGNENKALAAFAAGNNSKVIEMLEARTNKNPALSYLLAHAYYQNGNLDKAAAAFSSLAEQNGSPYQQSAGWYLALARLREGKTEEAKRQLTTISQDIGNPNQQRAIDMLARLDSGWRILVF